MYVLAVDVPGAHRSSLVFRKMGGFKNTWNLFVLDVWASTLQSNKAQKEIN